MAGDWLKMETDLPEKPEVWQIAGRLEIDPDAVVGKLFKVWRWFDKHTESGNAAGVTYPLLDAQVNVTGFAEAMVFVGWLEQRDRNLCIPNFDRHNGKTAKNRALTAKRVAKNRNDALTLAPLPREEKRREEKSKKTLERFEEFWSLYPNKKGRKEAEAKWAAKGYDAIADDIIADVRNRLTNDREWREGYAPHGKTYVNGEGWRDGIAGDRNKPAADDTFGGVL